MKELRLPGRTGDISQAEIRSSLQRVLASPPFRTSKRCGQFLNYVVTAVLEGRADTLKERTLATGVFGRSPSWDSGDDTIVRGGAREVRKRLAQYYSGREGMHDEIRIELPSGSYVPLFIHAEPVVNSPPELTSSPFERIDLRRPFRAWIRRTATVVLVAAITVIIVVLPRFARQNSFEEFWTPLWANPAHPILIAIAHPVVYHPSSRATRLNNQRLGPAAMPTQRPLELLPDELNGSDIVPVFGQYVGYGDTVAAANIAVLVGKHSRDIRLRSADTIEFADFREAPSVLIGAFTNRWTIELSQSFRFHFGYDAQGVPAILDSSDASRCWDIPSKRDTGVAAEDYFLVCRLADSPSGKVMMIAAGLTQFGTEAAGRFLLDSDYLNSTLRQIGGNWQNRNIEMVFHAKVVGNSPSASNLIASRVW